MSQSTHDKLRHAQELLRHQLPSGDVADVFDRALDALIEKLEKRKCPRARRPLPGGRPSTNPSHIPAHVRRAVWERDRGQCKAGRRCTARTLLEFDHVVEAAQAADEERRNAAQTQARAAAHEVVPWLRALGFGADEARRAAARCETVPDASSLERRVRLALTCFGPRTPSPG